MAKYTPSDEDVREGYALAPFEEELPDYGDEFLGQMADDRRAAWSRWLAAHDARVRREGAREALEGLAADALRTASNEDVQRDDTWADDARLVARSATEYRDAHYPETEDQT